MHLVEIRDLDGPNLFLLEPAIKLEFRLDPDDISEERVKRLESRFECLGLSDESWLGGVDEFGAMLIDVVSAIHRRLGVSHPEAVWEQLETPGHVALAFGWQRRRLALGIAKLLAEVVTGDGAEIETALQSLTDIAKQPADKDDRPLMVRDAERRMPIVGITGTNGKTTTTRLVSHVLTANGRRVGWSSSSGVYIEGEPVIEGDYTGPAGARRVLEEPNLDVAVLETARGGILLRGLGYESNDVSVFLNVSGDHLDLHGIHTLAGLARVKATVIRVTKSSGTVVLNAEDSHVRGVASSVRAPITWISRDPSNSTVSTHIAAGGRAVVFDDDKIVEIDGDERQTIADISDVPITFSGRAPHMVENALAAAAACRGLGLTVEQIGAGLSSFKPSADSNTGRLNVYEVDGVTVIIDFAHNEAGLTHLLALARSYFVDNKSLISIVGTAGDRTDDALRSLGRIAAIASDHVVIKETHHYLRGRASTTEMTDLFVEGIRDAGETPHSVAPDELSALEEALTMASSGDVLAMMCIEDGPAVRTRLLEIGREVT